MTSVWNERTIPGIMDETTILLILVGPQLSKVRNRATTSLHLLDARPVPAATWHAFVTCLLLTKLTMMPAPLTLIVTRSTPCLFLCPVEALPKHRDHRDRHGHRDLKTSWPVLPVACMYGRESDKNMPCKRASVYSVLLPDARFAGGPVWC